MPTDPRDRDRMISAGYRFNPRTGRWWLPAEPRRNNRMGARRRNPDRRRDGELLDDLDEPEVTPDRRRYPERREGNERRQSSDRARVRRIDPDRRNYEDYRGNERREYEPRRQNEIEADSTHDRRQTRGTKADRGEIVKPKPLAAPNPKLPKYTVDGGVPASSRVQFEDHTTDSDTGRSIVRNAVNRALGHEVSTSRVPMAGPVGGETHTPQTWGSLLRQTGSRETVLQLRRGIQYGRPVPRHMSYAIGPPQRLKTKQSGMSPIIRSNSKPMNLGQRLATKAGKIGLGASLAASLWKSFEAGKKAYDSPEGYVENRKNSLKKGGLIGKMVGP